MGLWVLTWKRSLRSERAPQAAADFVVFWFCKDVKKVPSREDYSFLSFPSHLPLSFSSFLTFLSSQKPRFKI